MTFFFIYSHFTFWSDDLRTLIKNTRKRKGSLDDNDYKLNFQKSKDYHESITKRLGILPCLLEFYKYNYNLLNNNLKSNSK